MPHQFPSTLQSSPRKELISALSKLVMCQSKTPANLACTDADVGACAAPATLGLNTPATTAAAE